MSTSWLGFRRRLTVRLLDAASASSLGLLLANACSGRTEHDAGPSVSSSSGASSQGGSSSGDAGRGSGGGGSGVFINVAGGDVQSEPALEQRCLSLSQGGGGSGGTGGVAGAAGGVSTAGTAGAGGVSTEPEGGATTEAGSGGAAACPDASSAALLFSGCNSGVGRTVEITGGPYQDGAQCCYDLRVLSRCGGYVGRAFLVEGEMIKARARSGEGWALPLAPQVEPLSASTRRALADAWIKDGLFEHASVATFSRFAIQLLSVGAPARLLHETLAAGRDEIRHAELCFALASAYAGEPLEPDRFPIDAQLPVDRTLEAIVAETVVEGCIGETLAALQARAQLDTARDPAVRAALEATVEDETRHAELAWRVVAWAIRAGGSSVRRAAELAFSGFVPPPAPQIPLEGVNLDQFAEHGRLTPDAARAVALEAIFHVVRPVAAGLLEADVFETFACSESRAAGAS
jgi:hypothetical protein